MENHRSAAVIGILQEEKNLLSSVQDLLQNDDERVDNLFDLIQAHNSKTEDYNLREILELSSKTTMDEIWKITTTTVKNIAETQSYLVADINMDVDDDLLSVEESFAADEKNRQLLLTSQQTARRSLNLLRAVSSLVLVSISKAPRDADASRLTVETKPSTMMFETLSILHSMLFSIAAQSDEGEAVTVIIARCCERWWVRNLPRKEELVTQLLPYLLASAMTENSTGADLKRLNGVRHALELLDFNHPTAATIKNLIIRCTTTPMFLKGPSKKKKKKKKKTQRKLGKNAKGNIDELLDNDGDDDDDDVSEMTSSAMSEGQRILSYALNLCPNLAKDMWSSIKSCLKHQTKAVWSSYGTVLFRAWKACEEQDVLDVLEQDIIQDIMECGTKVADKVR